MKPKLTINNTWVSYLFKTAPLINEFRKNSQGLTSDTWNLKYPQIKAIPILVPCIEEQTKNADFLSSLDAKLTAEQQKLDFLLIPASP
ncbi:MAG: restriction endonuclease subunit S [Candidatus Desulfaltia sp.]|nr:restriction endonuclease subunit S [Candidatus Desulfaltia sp.]